MSVALPTENSTLSRKSVGNHITSWSPVPPSCWIIIMSYVFSLLLAVIFEPQNHRIVGVGRDLCGSTFLCSCELQWICWMKQEAGIPQNSSTHPETLFAVLLSWKLGSTMSRYFFQLNWRCAWLCSFSWVISQHHCFFSCVSFPLLPMVDILPLDATQSYIL